MADDRTKKFNAERTRQRRRKTAIQRDTYAELQRLLKQADAEIRAILVAAPSDYQQWLLPQLQASVRQALTAIGEQMGSTVSNAAGQAWQAGLDLVDAPLAAGGVQVAGLLPAIDTQQLVAMRTFMTDRIKDITLQAINKINAQIGLSAIGAQPVGDTIGAVSRVLGKGSRGRALTIVRTELGRAYSVATQQRQAQAAELLPGLKKQWRRSGKVHSRISHDAADGQIREVDKPFSIGGVSLMHPRDPAAPAEETINCGCDNLPYMEGWDMATPGKKPFSAEEQARSPIKRDLAAAGIGA